MVKIVIENLGQKEVPVSGAGLSALRHFHATGIDWMHACGGKGRCTTCRMEVIKGGESLGPPTTAEQKYRRAGLLLNTERLACQAIVSGDIVVRVPEETRLPHLNYTS